jgi:uncharacterized protein (DUF362 family)/NAD-dependent dihydropyrimidine dehydrogenase PreA subunit
MDNQVAVVRCTEYETQSVEAAVRRAVDLLGGMHRFVQPGQRVLVKPNLLQPTSELEKAINTHPTVIRAVVRLAQEAGGRVTVADNNGIVPLGESGWLRAYERMGLASLAAETGAELNTRVIAQQRPHPDGHLLRLVDTSSFLTDADVVINVPKLKTHDMMRFTGAVKNLFGTVPGLTKPSYHVKLQTADRFAEMLLDLVTFVRPALSVMDAVVGMDGDGPAAGRPFPIGAILAGPDPTAVDVAALALVSQEPASVPTVQAAIRRGWTTGRPADLDVLGDGLAALRVSGFRLPPGGQRSTPVVPPFLLRLGTRQLVAHPFVTERCVGCGVCIEGCPVQTIAEDGGRACIHLDRCIRCYCCHEACPEQAIELHYPWLGRLLGRLRR